jgi:hypothetical protein
MEIERPIYTAEELEVIKELPGKSIETVIYHNWINNVAGKDEVNFLFAIELHFSDATDLLISSGDAEEDARLCFNNFSIEKEKIELEEKFNGQLEIVSTAPDVDTPWADYLGESITDVHADQEKGTTNFHSDFLVLGFGSEKIIITTGEFGDGLYVAYVDKEQG